jgi:two-component system NtrC family sensor kinase
MKSIRTKFQIYLTIVILVILIITYIIIIQSINFFIDRKETQDAVKWLKDFESFLEPNFVYYNYMNLLSQTEESLKERNEDFIILSDSNKKEIIHKGIPFNQKNQISFGDRITIRDVRIHHIPYLIITIPVRAQDLETLWGYISYGKSLREKNKLITEIKKHFLYLYIVLFLLSIILLNFIIRRIIRPIRELKNGMEIVSNGDLDYRIKISSRDEFSFLAEKYNEMCEKLKNMIITLENTQKDLENQITERTRTLNVTNHKLQTAMEELKTTQNQIIQSEKQKSLTAIVSGFAHEINNPLTGILGYIDLMELQDDISSYTKKKLAEIKYQSHRIKDIIGELNQLNPDAHQKKLEINLSNLLDKLIKIIGAKKENHGIIFQKELGDHQTVVNGNHFSLWQVFEGIIENAIEAIKDRNIPEGKIKITIKKSVDNSRAIIEISDNGGGFSNIEKAFDPFFTTKNRTQKKGIGLSIAYNLIQEHKGDIMISNNNEKGATVTVRLPLKDFALSE